jgi:hypothetical protein
MDFLKNRFDELEQGLKINNEFLKKFETVVVGSTLVVLVQPSIRGGHCQILLHWILVNSQMPSDKRRYRDEMLSYYEKSESEERMRIMTTMLEYARLLSVSVSSGKTGNLEKKSVENLRIDKSSAT